MCGLNCFEASALSRRGVKYYLALSLMTQGDSPTSEVAPKAQETDAGHLN